MNENDVLHEQNKTSDSRLLPGTRIGSWTVLEGRGKSGRYAAVECRCDCGTVRMVQVRKLLSGHSKSCGCSRKAVGSRVRKDISGRTFRELTALYATDQRDEKGTVVWHCRCSCGNELDLPYNVLVHGVQVSCGCQKKKQQRELHETVGYVAGTAVSRIRSRSVRADNHTGVRGVYMKRGKYVANICFRKHVYYLGSFEDLETARQVREEAEHALFDDFLEYYNRWKARADEDSAWGKENPIRLLVEQRPDGEFQIHFHPLLQAAQGRQTSDQDGRTYRNEETHEDQRSA